MNVKEAILNIIKGSELTNDDRKEIITEAMRRLSPTTVFPDTEIPVKKPLSENDKRAYTAVYGVKKIAEARLKQFTKGHAVATDSVQTHSLLAAAIFCLTEEPEFYPEYWDKRYMEKFLGKEEEEKAAIAGAFLAAYLDAKEFAREQEIRHEKELADFVNDSPNVAQEGLRQQAMGFRTPTEQDFGPIITATQAFATGAYTRTGTIGDFIHELGRATEADSQDDDELTPVARQVRYNHARRTIQAQNEWYDEEPTREQIPVALRDQSIYENDQAIFDNERLNRRIEEVERETGARFVRGIDPIAVGAGGTVDGAPPQPDVPIPNIDDLLANGDANIVEGDVEL